MGFSHLDYLAMLPSLGDLTLIFDAIITPGRLGNLGSAKHFLQYSVYFLPSEHGFRHIALDAVIELSRRVLSGKWDQRLEEVQGTNF